MIGKLEKSEIKNITVVRGVYVEIKFTDIFKLKGKNVSVGNVVNIRFPSCYDEPFTKLMNENLIKTGINVEIKETCKI